MIGCLATLERTAQFAMIVKVGMQKYRLNQRTQLVVILALDQIQINHVVKYLTEALVVQLLKIAQVAYALDVQHFLLAAIVVEVVVALVLEEEEILE